jgi:hypothetical protein
MNNVVTEIAFSLVCGGIGGSIAGSLVRKADFGPMGNTLIGVIGGGITLLLLNVTGLLVVPATLSGTLLGILGGACGSMIGGAALLAIVGLIKNAVVHKTA